MDTDAAQHWERMMRELNEAGERYLRLVPESPDDWLAVVLKSHLLIEEQLTRIIRFGVGDFGPLENTRIGFELKAKFAQAFAAQYEVPSVLWRAVNALNAARNLLGHAAEPVDLGRKLSAFFDAADEHRKQDPRISVTWDRTGNGMRVYCAMLFANLFATGEVMRITRERQGPMGKWPSKEQPSQGPQ
jgi:hypothetical protein